MQTHLFRSVIELSSDLFSGTRPTYGRGLALNNLLKKCSWLNPHELGLRDKEELMDLDPTFELNGEMQRFEIQFHFEARTAAASFKDSDAPLWLQAGSGFRRQQMLLILKSINDPEPRGLQIFSN